MDRLNLCRASLFWRTSLVVDRSYETVRHLVVLKQVQRKIIGSIYINKLRKNLKGGWWVLHPTIWMDGGAGALHSPDRCANLLGGVAQF